MPRIYRARRQVVTKVSVARAEQALKQLGSGNQDQSAMQEYTWWSAVPYPAGRARHSSPEQADQGYLWEARSNPAQRAARRDLAAGERRAGLAQDAHGLAHDLDGLLWSGRALASEKEAARRHDE